MVKKTVKKRAPATRVPTRQPINKKNKVLWPWIAGGVGILVVLILVVVVLRARQAPRPTGYTETYLDLTGSSYNGGATSARYPDPEGKGSGTRWLPALGREDAPVTVIEFTDFNCGHCQDYELQELSGILKDYVATGKVRYVGHYFSLFPQTQPLTLAAMCAAEQGRYFEFSHAYFSAASAGFNNVELVAQRVKGLDQKLFRDCVKVNPYYNALLDAINNAQTFGVRGTPSFLVNGKLIIGSPGLRSAIEEALTATNP